MAKDIIYPPRLYGTVRENITLNTLTAFNKALKRYQEEYKALHGMSVSQSDIMMRGALNHNPRLRKLFIEEEKKISKYQPKYLELKD